jgi:hypothetical protein
LAVGVASVFAVICSMRKKLKHLITSFTLPSTICGMRKKMKHLKTSLRNQRNCRWLSRYRKIENVLLLYWTMRSEVIVKSVTFVTLNQ